MQEILKKMDEYESEMVSRFRKEEEIRKKYNFIPHLIYRWLQNLPVTIEKLFPPFDNILHWPYQYLEESDSLFPQVENIPRVKSRYTHLPLKILSKRNLHYDDEEIEREIRGLRRKLEEYEREVIHQERELIF